MTDTNAAILEQLLKQNRLLEEHLEEQRKIRWEAWTTRREIETVRTLLAAPTLDDVGHFAANHQLGLLETVEMLRDEGRSFARFGDGEIQLMLRPSYKLGFQENSPALAAALKAVASTPSDSFLVGFPHTYRDLSWTRVWGDTWNQFKTYIGKHKVLGNSHVTRPLYFHETGPEGVKAWRAVWEAKSITVVTGKNSRFEFIPELFDSARETKVLESLPKNAFSDIPRIMSLLADDQADIVLIALGPAGTVLAAELANAGRQAIDVGHISSSYLQAFEGGAWPESLPVSKN